jgi:hypothetical protein
MSKKNRNKLKQRGVQILAIALAALMLGSAVATIFVVLFG